MDRPKPGKRGEVLIRATVRHRAGRLALAGALALGIARLALAPALADPPEAAAATSLATTGGQAGPQSLGLPTLTPFAGDPEIEDRLDSAGRVAVAGERVHEHLLRRFYNAHGYRIFWGDHAAAASALWGAVLRARDQGLDPASYHAEFLPGHWAELSPIERDLLLSDAFLSYADALAEGAVKPADRSADEDLRPGPVDVVAFLAAAVATADPARAMLALAPASAEYMAMRRAYLDYRAIAMSGGRASGVGNGGGSRASAAEARRRERLLAVNLERMRWLPRNMPGDRVVVDTAIAQLQLFRDDRPVFTTPVVIGEVDKQTPELQSLITEILFNPPWNIPRSILVKEILPGLARDRHYLAEHHMRYRGPMRVQQVAGPYSSLGRIKFEMSDRFDVYLHDTPEKWRFGAANRMMSHGCVRVESPQLLAGLLLGTGPEAIAKAIAVDRTHGRALPKPIPVFIVYRTAVVESDGAIAFRGDPYQRDEAIWEYLNRAEERPMAQDTTLGHRKG